MNKALRNTNEDNRNTKIKSVNKHTRESDGAWAEEDDIGVECNETDLRF